MINARYRNTDVVEAIREVEKAWANIEILRLQNRNKPLHKWDIAMDQAWMRWESKKRALYRLLNIKDGV